VGSCGRYPVELSVTCGRAADQYQLALNLETAEALGPRSRRPQLAGAEAIIQRPGTSRRTGRLGSSSADWPPRLSGR